MIGVVPLAMAQAVATSGSVAPRSSPIAPIRSVRARRPGRIAPCTAALATAAPATAAPLRRPEFRSRWAAHDVLIRHDGVKRLQHPEVGHLELAFQSLELPLPGRAVHELIVYTAELATASEERIRLLTIWAAIHSRAHSRPCGFPDPRP
nr:hypothetical protein [Acidiferrimicrobium sp. IK]